MGNEVCWRECNRRGGKCSFCGDGYCCNGKEGSYDGWNGDCPDGAIAVAPLKGHRCINLFETTTTPTTTPINTTTTAPTTKTTTSPTTTPTTTPITTTTTTNCKLFL